MSREVVREGLNGAFLVYFVQMSTLRASVSYIYVVRKLYVMQPFECYKFPSLETRPIILLGLVLVAGACANHYPDSG